MSEKRFGPKAVEAFRNIFLFNNGIEIKLKEKEGQSWEVVIGDNEPFVGTFDEVAVFVLGATEASVAIMKKFKEQV